MVGPVLGTCPGFLGHGIRCIDSGKMRAGTHSGSHLRPSPGVMPVVALPAMPGLTARAGTPNGGVRWVDVEDTRPYGDVASRFHGLSDHVPLIARFALE